jgi:ubiquinone/menaquinone biosynthesis C-methylase UbiE
MTLHQIEQEFVVNVYEQIAEQFDQTRGYVWPSVKKFINSLSPEIHRNILEIGCGNGRNMRYRPELQIIGCDIIPKFIDICKGRDLEVSFSDQRALTYESETFDVVLSIAVLHHLYLKDDRTTSINEIIRVLKPNGLCYIQVWKNITPNDLEDTHFVNWSDVQNKKTYKRFYHLFQEYEFRKLFDRNDIKIIKFFEERDNYICIFQKI